MLEGEATNTAVDARGTHDMFGTYDEHETADTNAVGDGHVQAPWPGRRLPLGGRYDGTGTNFAVWAGDADAVDLCLFEDGPGGTSREIRLPLRERTFRVWHGYVPGVGPGQRYGYRVHGRWDP